MLFAHELGGDGFCEMTEKEVDELLDSHNDVPISEELQQMLDGQDSGDDDDVSPQSQANLTSKMVNKS